MRHIDFIRLKIYPSKYLMVEVRPVECVISTSSGMKKTERWMSYEHWEELDLLLNDVTTLYEESKFVGSSEEVECKEYKMMDGKLINIGYKFMAYYSCQCSLMMPKDSAFWNDDVLEEEKRQILVGKACEERLIVSVKLQSHPVEKQLFKALGISVTSENSLKSERLLLHVQDQRLEGRIDDPSLEFIHEENSIHTSKPSQKKKRRLRESMFDTSAGSSDDSDKKVIKQYSDVLCKENVNECSSCSEKNICECHSESERTLTEKFIKSEKNDSSLPVENIESSSISTNSELCLYDNNQSIISEVSSCCVYKTEGTFVDESSLEFIKTEPVIGNVSDRETGYCSHKNVCDDNEVLKCCPKSENFIPDNDLALQCNYTVICPTGFNENIMITDDTPGLDKKDNLRNSLQCNSSNTFVSEVSVAENHILLNLAMKIKDECAVGPSTESSESQLCESSVSSVTNASSLNVKESNNVDDNPKLHDINADLNNCLIQTNCNDKDKPFVVNIPLGICKNPLLSVKKKTSSPAIIKSNSRRKNNKMRTLFGSGKEFFSEEIKPNEASENKDGESYIPEYVPLSTSSMTGDVTKDTNVSYPEYIPSPVGRKGLVLQLKRKVPTLHADIEHPNNDESCDSQFVEDEKETETSCRRSKRLQGKKGTGIMYNIDIFSFSEEEMSDSSCQQIGKKKKVKKPKLVDKDKDNRLPDKIIEKEKHKVIDQNSESKSLNEGMKHQHDAQSLKRLSKRKSLSCCSSDCMDDKGNQLYSSKIKKEFFLRSTTKDKEKAVIENKTDVSDTKPKSYINRGKYGIYETQKTREGKKLLRDFEKEIQDVQRIQLEDSPLSFSVPEDYRVPDSETEKISEVILPVRCGNPRGSKELRKSVDQIAFKDNVSRKCSTLVSENENLGKRFDKKVTCSDQTKCQKSERTRVRWRSVGRKKLDCRDTKKNSYNQRSLNDAFCDSSSATNSCGASYVKESKKNNLQSSELCGNSSYQGKDNEVEKKDNHLSFLACDVSESLHCRRRKYQDQRKKKRNYTKQNTFLHSSPISSSSVASCGMENKDNLSCKRTKLKGQTKPKRSYNKKANNDTFVSNSTPGANASVTNFDNDSKASQSQSSEICDYSSYHNSGEEGGNIDNPQLSLTYDADESLQYISSASSPHDSHVAGSSNAEKDYESLIDHLKSCKSMLTAISLPQLSEKLEEYNEYMRGIMNGKVFSERHQIFKEDNKAFGKMLNIEVLAAFKEEQSEFLINLVNEKYSDKLQTAINNTTLRSQYVWKVLVPSFYIKLTMDILGISNEKEAQDKLYQISLKIAD